MEEILLKYVELGALGIFSLLLLTKGLTNLNTLAQTMASFSEVQKALTATIEKLTDRLNVTDNKVSNIEREVRDLRNDFLETKQLLKSVLERSVTK